MKNRTKIVPILLEDGSVIKVQATKLSGTQDVASIDDYISLAEIADTIRRLATGLIGSVREAGPTKASITFGLEVAVESGKLTSLLVKGGGKGNLEISLEWELGKREGKRGESSG